MTAPDLAERVAKARARVETLEAAADREEAAAKRARRRANTCRRNYERLLVQLNGQGVLDFGDAP